MKNLEIIREDQNVSAYLGSELVGHISLSTVAVDESEYMGGFTYSLIEEAEVDEEYRRKGIYSAMVTVAIENLKEDEFLISMGRSNDAAKFWMSRLGISENTSEVDIEKEDQENVILIDSNENYEIKEIRDFSNIDFF